ncbi:hypothetical protein P174DRAFT_373992 [Aspergillus novofumigatus IBT 16806]|uniref:Uncharacterized protein n=1 Tax=Aspergillus novofumigatus (strain IBT 16806) TaxID=1392255 RepID=A0A2I1C1J5_ASPN1|nr:uncharacterized protein P174DRAFT_373992 [Aspergillus novofumigatus IBT 16806]PKX91516.1 hypothetical protein P174DRAFT_373992 [Aspergillus novofumigatus IBT 16806]
MALLVLLHTTIGCGKQGFPSAQPYLSHTPAANPGCCMFFFLCFIALVGGPALSFTLFILRLYDRCHETVPIYTSSCRSATVGWHSTVRFMDPKRTIDVIVGPRELLTISYSTAQR